MKRCTKCKEEKELKEFYNNKNANDGKNWKCRVCAKEDRKGYVNPPVIIEKNLNMVEVYHYDIHNNLLGMYENVLEAVLHNKGISSTDIYMECLGLGKIDSEFRWSFNQILSDELIKAIANT